MTLDLPALRLLAWQGPFPPCETCAKTQNHRCTTAAGSVTTPHASRMKWAAGYDARQPEVDELQRALDVANATVTDLSDGLRTMTANAAELTEQLKTARIGAALVPGLQQRVAELMAKVAELEKPPVEPEPEPAKALTFGVGVDQIPAGMKPQYHRTYFTLPVSGVHTDAVKQAKADIANGATPVMSFKLPTKGDFAGAVEGKYDAPVKATVDALAALGGIVIVAIEHEPEKYKDLPGFLAATAHFVPLVKRPTIQFWVGLMGYGQLYGSSEWKLAKILVPGVDGYGFDPYLSFGASSTKWTDHTTSYYAKFGAWAKAHGVQWGIWETGMNEQAATSGLPQATTFVADCAAGAKASGAAMWIWFASETTKDGKHDWRLTSTGADKLGQMAAVVKKYAR